jgi:uncharacterized protein Veg
LLKHVTCHRLRNTPQQPGAIDVTANNTRKRQGTKASALVETCNVPQAQTHPQQPGAIEVTANNTRKRQKIRASALVEACNVPQAQTHPHQPGAIKVTAGGKEGSRCRQQQVSRTISSNACADI